MTSAIQVFDFEGRPLRAYIFRGRPCWIAQEVGAALGYPRSSFVRALQDWADELIAGKDFETLRSADLREFKAIAALGSENDPSRAPSLTILYESGIDLVCLKTEKPLGKKLRRFMADEVMPRLRRGTLDPSVAERELVALSLRLTAGDAKTIWEVETVQELCRVHRKGIWTPGTRMAPWLRGPMGLIYKIVLGEVVYRELKERNPDPHDGSLNYHFLTEARHRLMQNDMGTVSALLRTSRTADEFFDRLRFAYKRSAEMQTSW